MEWTRKDRERFPAMEKAYVRISGDGGFAAINRVKRMSLMGRQREFATFVCSRSAAIVTRSPVTLKDARWGETMSCSTRSTNVKFRGGPVGRRENRQGHLSAAGVGRQARVERQQSVWSGIRASKSGVRLLTSDAKTSIT